MTKRDNNIDVFWRGAAQTRELKRPAGFQARERILLLVSSRGNRKRLVEQLERRYQVILPDEINSDEESWNSRDDFSFDLAVVDPGGVSRWRQTLVEARSRAQPVFLPAMLIAAHKDLSRALDAWGAHIDEFLLSPVDPSELMHRAELLLRARRQALTQSTRLAYLTSHDQSSGLPNKMLFLDRLSQAIQDATILSRKVYVMVVHVSLTSILKSLGNQALEAAGQACSEHLASLLEGRHSLARLSTEEWGVMLRGESTDEALAVFRRIQELGSLPIKVGNERAHISPLVGIAIYPNDATSAHTLLDCAGAALARTEHRSGPAFYSSDVQHQALSQIRTEVGLHEALAQEHFELWFQPKVNLKDRSPVSVEALIRWRLPRGELVPPGNFIPIAEKSGLINQIDRWVLAKACECMSLWLGRYSLGQVAVNISAQQLDMPDFVTNVKQTLTRFGVPPAALELELTETALADLGHENLEKLNALRQHGVSIALDDFGTGYCSLNYLQKLPITTLKIDKCFIDHIATDPSNLAITQTIVSLAKNFHLKLVAEGIETEEQLRCLSELEVEIGQGYLFARPMPVAKLEQWLGDGSTLKKVSQT